MRGESLIVDVPPEVEAETNYSEHDAALESERLESLISVLRQGRRAAGRDPLPRQPGAAETARARAAREMLAGDPASG